MSFAKRFLVVWNACSVTDRAIALFTGVLAFVAIYQFIILDHQLAAMRMDQRAWIVPQGLSGQTLFDKPLFANISLSNNGKTPAKHFEAITKIEVLDAAAGPTFDYSNQLLNTWTVGNLISPNPGGNLNSGNPPISVTARRQIAGTQTTEFILLSTDLNTRMNAGKVWMAVEGEVGYEDVFGAKHWLTFCMAHFQVPPGEATPPGAQKCAEYNNMDNN
jgi:hypothetical protein